MLDSELDGALPLTNISQPLQQLPQSLWLGPKAQQLPRDDFYFVPGVML
jgi:hypothetical protein